MAVPYVREHAVLDELPDVIQRRCVACRDWWPDDEEFYPRASKGRGTPTARCYACIDEARDPLIVCRMCGKLGIGGRLYCSVCSIEVQRLQQAAWVRSHPRQRPLGTCRRCGRPITLGTQPPYCADGCLAIARDNWRRAAARSRRAHEPVPA